MQESNNDYMNNKYPTNPNWLYQMLGLVHLISSVLQFGLDGNKYSHQPRNIDSGLVVWA